MSKYCLVLWEIGRWNLLDGCLWAEEYQESGKLSSKRRSFENIVGQENEIGGLSAEAN